MKKFIVKAVRLVIISLAVIILYFGFAGCKRNLLILAPTVGNITVSNITESSATVSVQITSDGGDGITGEGITVNGSIPTNMTVGSLDPSTNIFVVELGDLKPSSTYVLVASVWNSTGIGSNQSSFATIGIVPALWTISDGAIHDVATDASGNVYVTGTFQGVSTHMDCFVARFNADGTSAWRQNIVTPNVDYPRGGIIVVGDVVYVSILRNDLYGIGEGDLYVDAYFCDSGSLKWSTKTGGGIGGGLIVDNNIIYSISPYFITGVNMDNGKILSNFGSSNGGVLGGFAVIPDGFLIGGAYLSHDLTMSYIIKLDKNFKFVWERDDTVNHSSLSGVQGLVSFPEDSLVFSSESYGDPLYSIATTNSVVCYKIRADGSGLDQLWKKTFNNGTRIELLKDGNSLYVSFVFQGPVSEGPVKMSIKGDILWTASPKKNGYTAFSASKVFLADDGTTLTVYGK
jgi:hypothetical protein